MKWFAALAIVAALLAPEPTAQELREQLNSYLTDYEPKLSELIADELMGQENRRGNSPAGGGIGAPEYRTIRSEVAFIALPGDAGWMGFRRVLKVGGKDVDDALGSLNAVLVTGEKDDYARARAMLADSARFNLGSPRTINLPNLPLELLHPRHAHRFAVRIAGNEQMRGGRLTKLVFVENVTPTIIRAQDNADMRSIISAFVEPGTGRLWRADVITRDPRGDAFTFDHVIRVEFTNHKQLGLLVPATMHEDFFAGMNRQAFGDARYTNYRRFQTSGRIVPQ
jgi:hypothetical protein